MFAQPQLPTIMFVIPIPPTSKEIAATAPSSVVKVCELDDAVVKSEKPD
ncbi:MAG: hypothetical protein WDN07_00765 [Actinomycetota bacterium]